MEGRPLVLVLGFSVFKVAYRDSAVGLHCEGEGRRKKELIAGLEWTPGGAL